MIMKTKKNISKELIAMKKKNEISEALYTRLRSTGAQLARLYVFAKVHKQITPLHFVLYLSDSSCDNLNKTLAKFLMKLREQT